MRVLLAISFTILSGSFAFADDRIWLETAEFRKCLATDVKDFSEYRFAKAELEMLKTNGASR